MKCPKYIKEAIHKRAEYAQKFMNYDYMVSDWCDKHGVDLESYDCFGGCESVVNPYASANRVLKAINEK